MAIDIDKISRKISNKIDGFSSKYMSDAKWTKVFTILSQQSQLVNKCLIKDILDDVLREVEIPTSENFSETFHLSGIKDIMQGGSSLFKEIEWIEFPKNWTIDRQMRNEKLSPHKHEQDIFKIKQALEKAGELETEINDEKLIIYGYK